MGRNALREHYRQADVGISGVNFAVAETGTLCLVKTEGNGRMCTTLPDLHIAVPASKKWSKHRYRAAAYARFAALGKGKPSPPTST